MTPLSHPLRYPRTCTRIPFPNSARWEWDYDILSKLLIRDNLQCWSVPEFHQTTVGFLWNCYSMFISWERCWNMDSFRYSERRLDTPKSFSFNVSDRQQCSQWPHLQNFKNNEKSKSFCLQSCLAEYLLHYWQISNPNLETTHGQIVIRYAVIQLSMSKHN